MAKFNLDNYETVEDRLKKFWKENPDARINTEIAHITEDGTCVTVRAEVFKNEQDARPVATGIAQETKGQGGFAKGFDNFLERQSGRRFLADTPRLSQQNPSPR